MANKNPFIQTLKIPYVRVIKRDAPLATDQLRDGDYYDVEQVKSSRVYRTKGNLTELLGLSAGALRMYMYLVYYIPDKATAIRLDEVQLMEMFQCSAKHVMRMKSELVAAAIIAKKETNVYWINPRFFASGDRIHIYAEQAVCVATVRERQNAWDSILQQE